PSIEWVALLRWLQEPTSTRKPEGPPSIHASHTTGVSSRQHRSHEWSFRYEQMAPPYKTADGKSIYSLPSDFKGKGNRAVPNVSHTGEAVDGTRGGNLGCLAAP
ncbi:MAG: hypothetical protein OEN01_13785, partial [Candidatus Krumholzibacteria bacterium]|nr:hypothetical protein [Candidatus Krumholzibacteria bacterium]